MTPVLRLDDARANKGQQCAVRRQCAVSHALDAVVVLQLEWSSVLRHRRAAFLPCLGVAATVLAGAHGAVDYGIQIPAVAATYAAIMGAACAQAFRLEIPERRTGERRAG